MSTATTYQYLEPHPGSQYRQLFIRGTKLVAWDIYCAAYQRGDEDDRTPEQVAEDFGIPVDAVYEAIQYCESKPIELAYDQRRSDLFFEAIGADRPDGKYQPMTDEARNRINRQLEKEFGIR
jgi:uncharacterized protein (DUF433 family)